MKGCSFCILGNRWFHTVSFEMRSLNVPVSINMETWWNDSTHGITKILAEIPVQMPQCPPQIPHGMPRQRVEAFLIRSR